MMKGDVKCLFQK